MAWTDQQIDELKRLHAEGLSSREIGNAIGFSRGAVNGKIFRLGLCTPRNEQWGKGRTKKILSRSQREVRSTKGRLRREAAAAELRAQFACVEIIDLPPDQSAVAVPFGKLNNETCRWPLGDPRDLNAMRFCGDRPIEDRPYCKRHSQMAYVPRVYRPKYLQAAE